MRANPSVFRLAAWAAGVVIVAALSTWAQQPSSSSQPEQGQSKPQQQQIPDAPSAVRPPQTLPTAPQPTPPASQAPAQAPAQQPAPLPTISPDTGNEIPPPPPGPKITPAPPGGPPNVPGSQRDNLYKLVVNTNFVVVPVTVKGPNGMMVDGLLPKDFTVYEDGAPQKLTFFTSDPFPLSAAIVVDLSMSDKDVKKVQQSLPALVGAFGQFDEVSVFSYADTVQQLQDFTGVNSDRLTATMRRLKKTTGRTGGVPVTSGPLASGPTINGRPWNQNTQPMPTYQPEAHVLNDAILEAANQLSRRDPTWRKIIFVISDGREYDSDASYQEVLRVLLAHQITVYAVGVGNAALPGYSQAERIRIPGQGYGDILPKYVSATGGEVLNELSQASIERAYSRLTEEARNQYTLGYTTRATPSSTYRSIEVVVNRPGLKVHAKSGYYPLPPAAR